MSMPIRYQNIKVLGNGGHKITENSCQEDCYEKDRQPPIG